MNGDHDLLIEIAANSRDMKAALFGVDGQPGMVQRFAVVEADHIEMKRRGMKCMSDNGAGRWPPWVSRVVVPVVVIVASNAITGVAMWALFIYKVH